MIKFWKTLNIIYERVLLVALLVILVIVSWCMYDNAYVYSNVLDDSIKQYKPGQYGVDSESVSNPISDDMIAWITIDGTNIDYPVMQYTDNVKYLNTDPFGRYSLSGSIYLDYRCSPDFSDAYSLIYGHHMEYGKMFGALDDFLNESYLLSHTTGTLIIGKNAEKFYDLEVFAAMTADARNNVIFNMDQEEIRGYIMENAQVFTHDSPERVICLSTCAEASSTTRVVVFCFMTESNM